MCGKALAGSTVGIFGMGRIGESVAEKLAAFKPQRIIYHNRKPKDGSTLFSSTEFSTARARGKGLGRGLGLS